MRAPRLRLMITPRTRVSGQPVHRVACDRRLLPLTWRRIAPRAALLALTQGAHHLQQHFNTRVHLHLSTRAPTARQALTASAVAANGAAADVSRASSPLRHIERLRTWQTQLLLEHRSERLLTRTLTSQIRSVRPVPSAPRASLPHAASRLTIAAAMPKLTRAPPAAGGSLPRIATAPASMTNYSPEPGMRRLPRPHADPARGLPMRAPSLVWEKSTAAVATAASAVSGLQAGSASPAAASGPRDLKAAGTLLPPAQIQQLARATQRALFLDASLAERLADDVLKRVDKRLRIERERRGL
jgi:hypothetical protein